jgi:hypothetical protein
MHSLAAGQEKRSEPVLQFLQKPRLGDAQLTRRDGQTQKGRILRVTDQFIAFETNQRPRACENVALSEIAAVQSLRTPGEPGIGTYVAEVFYLGVFLGPFFVADAVAYPFKRISPPMKPLSGSWEGGVPNSSLQFTGQKVQYRTTTNKRGRWLVEHDKLHLMLNGEPEWVGRFHFECGELVMDDPREEFRESGNPKPARAPIVGDWAGRKVRLNLKSDGSVAEEKSVVRYGTFENTSTSVKIHWADSTGPGGAEWVAPIEHRRMVVSIGGVTTKYHFAPPSIFEFDD